MSHALSLRLRDDQMARLERLARRLGRRPSETAALLVEESLRESEFALIEFRDTAAGREAFLRGTRLKVWQACWLARHFDGDPARVAEAIGVPCLAVQAALNYANAFPDEIEFAISDNNKSIEELRRLIPNLEVITVDASAP